MRRDLDEDLHRGDRDTRPAALARPPGPRPEARRPDGHPVREQAGMGHGRFRRPLRRGGHRAHLHFAPARPGPLHPR
ncbi:MAG: hypothetical protein MZV63_63025 [Marinilabiliales bacterium]|nr:hypothetical protein [Marinilabiliales bacterium]